MKLKLLVSAVVLNAAFVLIGRGSFMHVVLVLAFVLYVGAPTAVIALFLYFYRRPRFRQAATAFAAVAAVAVSTILSGLIGRLVRERDIAQAQAFCEASIPQLDRYRKEHGVYPKDITKVMEGAPPYLLRDGHFYHSDGSSFQFSFMDPGGMMNGYALASDDRRWSEWD